LVSHPLQRQPIVREIESAATAHLGGRWVAAGFTDLNDRASHPCGLFLGQTLSVFAKLDPGPNGSKQLTAELRGLRLLRERAHVTTPTPIGSGVIHTEAGSLLLFEGVREVPAEARAPAQWRSIGNAMAMLHQVHDERFGLAQFDGFFGPLHQDNRPMGANVWADFYAERRLVPLLRSAVDSGHLPLELAAGVERIVNRLPLLCGPQPRPSLLHGDAQQNNFLTTATDAVLIDPAPYFGHPEIDLALVDYFAPVPDEVLAAYRDARPIDPEFQHRRELWRLSGYLAVITVDGASVLGRSFLNRVADAIARYR
jgi:fructosamine-3-kinase